MPFDQLVSDSVMVKCGRHCCICRRFKPTLLQVHHILPESEGGMSTEDNAIALCINCHSDVHTKRPFVRRFSPDELAGHRDNTYGMIARGELTESDHAIEPRVASLSYSSASNKMKLSGLAARILSVAADDDAIIFFVAAGGGSFLQAGSLRVDFKSNREVAEYKEALDDLESARLIRREYMRSGNKYILTHAGYLCADTLIACASTQN